MTDAERSGGKFRQPIPCSGRTIATSRSRRAQRRRDLGADEAASDHREPRALVAQRARPPVVVEVAEVDDVGIVAAEPPGRAAGGEHELLVPVLVACRRPARAWPATSIETTRRPRCSSTPFSAVFRQIVSSSSPAQSPFVSGGRLYGACGSSPTSPIVPALVERPNPLADRIGGHAPADDQVAIRLHLGLAFSRVHGGAVVARRATPATCHAGTYASAAETGCVTRGASQRSAGRRDAARQVVAGERNQTLARFRLRAPAPGSAAGPLKPVWV